MDTKTLAQQFRQEAAKLLKAADALEGKLTSSQPRSSPQVNLFSAQRELAVTPSGPTRLDQIKSLIRSNGPMKIADLVANGVPRGTASSLVKESNGFKRDDQARWSLR